jgi:hypothetical protein
MASITDSRLRDPQAARDQTVKSALDNVADALGRLRYGAIQITVHDGRPVQLDVTERQRFT